MARKKVMFTGGGGAAAEAIFRLWVDRYDLFFADADPACIDASIPHASRVAIPFARDPVFVPRMMEIVRSLGIDVLVPGVDEELYSLASARADFAPTTLLGPEADFIAAHLDKLQSANLLHRAGLTAPRTVPLADAKAVSAPFIAKPKSGRGSRGVMALECHAHIPAYLALNKLQSADVIAQELIRGQEYTVFVAADDSGFLRAIVPVKVMVKRGITIAAEVDSDPVVIDYVRRFHCAFNNAGVYNIQLIKHGDQAYPFEINPRVSTTICLVAAAGYDPIDDLANPGDRPPFIPTIRHTLRRNWHNYFGVAKQPAIG